MIATASSMTSRLRSPRKSILSRPIASIGPIEYWVTVLYARSGLPFPSPFPFGRSAVLGELQRHDLLQRPVGDHDRGGVDRVVPDDALQALGGVEDLLRIRVGVIGALELLTGLQALLEARAPAEDRLGDLLGQTVAGRVVIAEDSRRVPDGGAGRHLAEGDDLGDALAAVLVGDVSDHTLPPAD